MSWQATDENIHHIKNIYILYIYICIFKDTPQKKGIQMAKNHIKKFLTSLANRKIQKKTTRYHYKQYCIVVLNKIEKWAILTPRRQFQLLIGI